MSSPTPITVDGLRDEVEHLLADAPDGAPLSPVVRHLVRYGVCSSVMILDHEGARTAARDALRDGAGPGQLQEVLTLVSGLGVHTLMEGSRDLAALLRDEGKDLPAVDDERAALRERLLGPAPTYWASFESHVPGFLDALLRLAPEVLEGFIAYGALPARTRQLEPVVREILSVAVDALPNHRYMPGLRLHLTSALRLGAGRSELLEALAIAAEAPTPPGVG